VFGLPLEEAEVAALNGFCRKPNCCGRILSSYDGWNYNLEIIKNLTVYYLLVDDVMLMNYQYFEL
jgi:hypothetical protein